jgi:uncharacterized protein (DUF433 family)
LQIRKTHGYNAFAMNTSKYIISDPQIMGGAPVIKGTRTPIEVILYRLKEGNSLEAIYEMYPWITIDTLSGALEAVIRIVTTALPVTRVSPSTNRE